MAALLADPMGANALQHAHEVEVMGLVREALLCLDGREPVRQPRAAGQRTS